MFRNMKLSVKLSLIVIFSVVILSLTGAIAIMNFKTVKKDWTGFLEVVQKKQKHLMDIRSNMGYGGAIHLFKNFVLRGAVKYHDRYVKRAATIEASVKAYKEAGSITSVEEASLKQVLEMVDKYRQASFTAKKLFEEGKTTNEIDKIIKISDKPYLEALTALSGELDKATENRSNALTSLVNNVIATLTVVIPVAIIILIAVGFFIARSITRPVDTIINSLTETSSQLRSSSSQISTSSQSLAEGATEQASSLEETSSSLEEIASMTRQNADNANSANSLMDESKRMVDEGVDSMKSMITAMDSIKDSSGEISKIIKVIEEIAFQTNLLALNAAVEAARAGEHGKGFAVVAEEVRNLAQRSATASKDTASLIENAVKKADEGGKIVSQSAKSLDAIAGSIKKVGDLVGEIAAASGEQSNGIDQVNKAVSQMDAVTQRNAASAEESASASEELNAQAINMGSVVNDLIHLVKGSSSGGVTSVAKPALPAKRQAAPGLPEPVRRKYVAEPENVISFDDTDFKNF